MKRLFSLSTPFKPSGSQPEAITELLSGRPGKSTLIGVTGSGKTFTVANVIAKQNKPVLVVSPNKTLAAQLYEELSLFFPKNKVCYFVSYYDYYQPESYLPAQDVYIPKETKINSEIERLRIEATASLINRRDTIVVTSVSCLYSLGNPSEYRNLGLSFTVGQKIKRDDLIHKLIFIQYVRNDNEKDPGMFRVIGNTIDIHVPYQRDTLRVELAGDTIESIQLINRASNDVLMNLDNSIVFPAKHFVTTDEKKSAAIARIKNELQNYLPQLPNDLYKERLQARVNHDLEMIQEVGYCSGIENYSAHFDGRKPGQAPFCLFDFFNDDFLVVIDESHIAIPQLQGMYAGDKARKKALINFGFRLPSAYDNRPLKFEEIQKYLKDIIYISATPSEYELKNSDQIVEQVIRPTGLLDPVVEIHPRKGQILHLISSVKKTTKNGFRTLVTVLTKRLAEELAHYLEEKQIKVCYLHSELKTPQRTELLQKLRLGVFDCLVGVNLLREGLDLPEVAHVAIMDADIESFLRDKCSLIQIIGRATRNTESKVIMYADKVTKSMKNAMDETDRHRELQKAYNEKHGIQPTTVKREVKKSITNIQEAIALASAKKRQRKQSVTSLADKKHRIIELEQKMHKAAENLNFEQAIALRDELSELKKR